MIRERGQQEVDALRGQQLLGENGQQVLLVPSEADTFRVVKGFRRLEVNWRRVVAQELYWLLRLSVLTSGKKQSSRNPFHHLPGVWMARTWE
jgi:hypothetical protein